MSDKGHTSGLTYLGVWIALLVLTVLSFWTAPMDFGGWDAPIMLGIATVKAVLVVMIFMHLRESHFANKMVVIVSTLFVILLVGLLAADVATRTTFPIAPQERQEAEPPAQ